MSAAIIAALLSGCALLQSHYENRPSDGGRPAVDVVSDIEAVPGVASASWERFAWSQNGEGGLGASSGVSFLLTVRLDDGVRFTDPERAVRDLAELAWSVNDGYSPSGKLGIMLYGVDPARQDWSWAADQVFALGGADDETKWFFVSSDERERTRTIEDEFSAATDAVFVSVRDRAVEHVLGRWPTGGDTSLGDLTTTEAYGLPLPVVGAAGMGYAFDGEDCLSFAATAGGRPVMDAATAVASIDRSAYESTDAYTDALMEALERSRTPVGYDGEVTVTLTADGDVVATKTDRMTEERAARQDPRISVSFCLPHGQRWSKDAEYVFTVSSEPGEGWATLDEERYVMPGRW